ncbi:ribonucleotide reductase subunit alpha [Halomonas sp.]|uniref:ribonucleotide reductase subunit alpha n=1 Tax=Halomonas sp. TaxID=1486246 RepID=UPI0025C14029|nr:ribonucleotide reductase subunit alpha [Halomonas sp.]
MAITNFADLISEARLQPDAQRLLFVFIRAELPDNPTAEQRRNFEQGVGGVLTPALCVDKAPEELSDMAALVAESRETGIEWDIVFVGALSGRGRPDRLTSGCHHP